MYVTLTTSEIERATLNARSNPAMDRALAAAPDWQPLEQARRALQQQATDLPVPEDDRTLTATVVDHMIEGKQLDKALGGLDRAWTAQEHHVRAVGLLQAVEAQLTAVLAAALTSGLDRLLTSLGEQLDETISAARHFAGAPVTTMSAQAAVTSGLTADYQSWLDLAEQHRNIRTAQRAVAAQVADSERWRAQPGWWLAECVLSNAQDLYPDLAGWLSGGFKSPNGADRHKRDHGNGEDCEACHLPSRHHGRVRIDPAPWPTDPASPAFLRWLIETPEARAWVPDTAATSQRREALEQLVRDDSPAGVVDGSLVYVSNK